MIYLLLCIILNSGLFVVFKYAGKHNTSAFPFLSINYFVAGTIGVVHHLSATNVLLNQMQFLVAICAGFVFIFQNLSFC